MQPRNGGPLPNGLYQIVDSRTRTGSSKESGGAIGSVSCTTVNLSIGTAGADFGVIHVPSHRPGELLAADLAGSDADRPRRLNPIRRGLDPRLPPHVGEPLLEPRHAAAPGNFPAAHTLATGNPSYIPSVVVAERQRDPGGDLRHGTPGVRRRGRTRRRPPRRLRPARRPDHGQDLDPGPAPCGRTVAKTRTRTALRRVFGTGLSRLSVACRLRTGGASTCTVSWRKSSARYSGHVYLRNHRVNGRLRWQYRVDVTKKKGKKTTHVRARATAPGASSTRSASRVGPELGDEGPVGPERRLGAVVVVDEAVVALERRPGRVRVAQAGDHR